MDTQSPRTGHQPNAVVTSPDGLVSRRRLLAGSLASTVVAAGAFRIAGAQDDPATPDATPGGTPAVDTNGTAAAGTDQALAEEAVTRADAIIRSVRTDRDSVASSNAVSDVDPILSQADIHHDRAEAALASGTEPEAVREATVAGAAARTARLLLEARLSYPGLPSQDVRTSRGLVRAYEDIAAVSADAGSATDANVGFFITNAQQLYASASDLYAGGAFAQAAGTAQAATSLARIATLLMADPSMIGGGWPRRGGGNGARRGLGGENGGRMGPGWPGTDQRDDLVNGPFGAEDQEPVPVPAPDF